MTGSRCWPAQTGWRLRRQRSLAAAVDWSYQLLDDDERRVFRAVSVFPGPFTLEAAEAVAGAGAGPAVLRLVDCSLASPPQDGPDGRSRYVMLETLRAYGAGLLARAGEDAGAAAALARYALGVAEQAAAGLRTSTDVAAARWLDAEDATLRQALAWAGEYDTAVALRLAVALAPWWYLRTRCTEAYPLLREAAARAAVGTDLWCDAQYWLGRTVSYSGDLAGALGHFTAVRDALAGRPPGRALADCLAARTGPLAHLGRIAEAVDDGHRALALARDLRYRFGEYLALTGLTLAAEDAGDLDGALALARQAGQVTGDIPGFATRNWSCIMTHLLTGAGDLAAAEATCAAGLARAREADDLWTISNLLNFMAEVDLEANRIQDAAAHLREALQIATRTGGGFEVRNGLIGCAWLCTATGRPADALTAWAAVAASFQRAGLVLPSPEADPRHPLQGALRAARQALGVRPGPRRRRTRRGDEPGHRGRVRPDAHRARRAAAGPGAGTGEPKRPGTGAGHPGRPGPHRRADRRRVVHQHPHRALPPGPDPGQDRRPPPRRPDPPGPHGRTRLTGARAAAGSAAPVGTPTPPPARTAKGVSRPLPRSSPRGRTCHIGRTGRLVPNRQETIMTAHLSRRETHPWP